MKITRRFVRRSAKAQLRKGLTHQQVYETLAGEFGFRDLDDMRTLNRIANYVEQIPGFSALKKERWRRLLLILILVFLALAESFGSFPIMMMFGLHELSNQVLIPLAVVLFIYPAIYIILAILAVGRSMYLYRWIMIIMLIALLKDLPAFSLYFNAERLMFGLVIGAKVFSLLVAFMIYRGLKGGTTIEVSSIGKAEVDVLPVDDNSTEKSNPDHQPTV